MSILNEDHIIANAKNHISKLNENYIRKIKGIYEPEKKLISGFMNKYFDFCNINTNNFINIILEFYFGFTKEEYKDFSTKLKYKLAGDNFHSLIYQDLNLLNNSYDVFIDGYNISFENYFYYKDNLKYTIKLHKSGYYTINEELQFFCSFYISKYLFEEINAINLNQLLKCYLTVFLNYKNYLFSHNNTYIKNKTFKVALKNKDKISHIIALLIIKSKNTFNKEPFLIELLNSINYEYLPYIIPPDYINIIKEIRQLYFGVKVDQSLCLIL